MSGHKVIKIEKGLYYNISVSADSLTNDLDKLPKAAQWCVFFVNMEKQIKRAYYPFTLSIKNPDALFAFYSGQCMIAVFVDLNVIEEQFGKQGIAVEFYKDGDYFLRMEKPQSLAREVRVSNHFIGRLGSEFLSLEWMIEEMSSYNEVQLTNQPSGSDTGFQVQQN